MKHILTASAGGLKGFPDAISTAFPETQVQLSIVHMVRNSVKYVPWNDYKPVTADLKRIYQSVTEKQALQVLDELLTAGMRNTLKSLAPGEPSGRI